MKDKFNIGLLDHYTSEMTLKGKRRFFANENGDPLHAAFDRKSAVHPGARGQPLDPKAIQEVWSNSLAAAGKKEKRVAYFHIPFCETHCLFCGFYQNPYRAEEEDHYIDCVIRELEMVANAPFIKSHPFHAIYLGGGTPTALSVKNLSRLLKAIRNSLPLANDCEITVEGRIYHFPDDKVFACLEGGVNRFSIGVQSFDTFVRRKMGRIEPREKIIERLKYLNGLDQAVIVIDLIYGLPYQTMEIWEQDVTQYTDLGLDGVDLYQLNIYKGGKLEQAAKKGIVQPPADIPMQADMFARGVEIMKQARYRRFSMSHWGRTTRERNIYNALALSGKVCVPFGSGAGGWLNGYFFFQENELDGYYRRIDQGSKPIAMAMKQPGHNDLFKEFVGQMEQGHCYLKELGEYYGFNLEEIFSPLLDQWKRVGLIKMDDGWIELTLAGEFWQVNLCQALIDYFTIVFEKHPASPGMMDLEEGNHFK
ncbi:MAG: heme anaerobic degradation radical SAM methyltransferase ChuW/HutW [Deltaproteobacteria bacterium]|nr:heme anaerobic degradation radical SAM methyltransferase ChuW/HutW [Deltaproteobacteria bacterium]